MEIKTLNKELGEKFNCKFDVQATGSYEWVRAFVQTKEGVSLGRFSLKNGVIESYKYYKPFEYNLDESDAIMLRLAWYLFDSVFIPLNTYKRWVIEARLIRAEDIIDKIAWRKANPLPKKNKIINGKKVYCATRGRGKITGKSERSCLLQIYRERKDKFPK